MDPYPYPYPNHQVRVATTDMNALDKLLIMQVRVRLRLHGDLHPNLHPNPNPNPYPNPNPNPNPTQPAVASKPDAPPLLLTAGRIAFDNVTFAYTDGQQLLRGVSFAVEPGQTMAIVGGSGSGKSTVLRLLYRFYDVHDGAITVDGQDLREVELDSLRSHFGIVPQVRVGVPVTPPHPNP